ncbi:MAG: hypothetical protein KKD31_03615, partial [Bacteroidetes bacterium]|nr:hypothetical protein [Bacteroidota bacterium]
MKKIYIPLIISVFASCLMNAQPTNWFGDLTTTNNSNYTDTSMTDRGVLMATQPLQATVSKPNAKFIFNTAVGVWDPKWTGSNAPDTIRTTNSKLVGMAYFGHDEAWQWDFTTNITSGNYYTFLCGKNAAANNDMSVLETTFLPVIIDSISADASGTILPATAVNVTVCLNADTSAGEKVFLRYTTDGWSTSAFVEVSVYDVNHDGAAVIPGQISGTTVEYYILTTIDDTPDAADIDYLTLRIMNNANANYSYNVLSDKSLTVSADSILHELTLDNRVLYLKLGNETFADATLEDTNFVLLNAPAGVGIDSVTYLSTDSVSLALSFDATDFDADSTHFMVKIKAVELTGTEDLTSNAITIFYENENAGLWCHLLTTDTIEHYLGDVTGHWINMEIGQATWDATHIGYGLSNSDSTGWTWQDATWYADGTPPNKQVHSLIVIPPALGPGSFWYAGRFRDNGAGPWYIANNGNWSNSLLFSPEQYITVSALPIPASCGATAYNGNRIDLSWTANSGLPNVIITARENSDLSANPVQGTTYNVDDSIGGGVVVYRGSGTSFAHTGLNTDA